MSKRIVFCFDGTWNKLDSLHTTNVVALAERVKAEHEGKKQIVYYDQGVGTRQGEKWRGGLFGQGLMENLSDAYRFLIFNHAPGDQIYILGYSRGAYTARSFAGLIKNCGILPREKVRDIRKVIDIYRNRKNNDAERTSKLNALHPIDIGLPSLDYLGVWDTVGSLGIPKNLSLTSVTNRKHQFHDLSLSPLVKAARHAVSIDERRRSFEPTLWDNLDRLNSGKAAHPFYGLPYQQHWFPGTHGSVGGGGEITGLSNGALLWVMAGAIRAGLGLYSSSEHGRDELSIDPGAPLSNMRETKGFSLSKIGGKILPKRDRLPGPAQVPEVAYITRERWTYAADQLPEGAQYRPPSLGSVASLLDAL